MINPENLSEEQMDEIAETFASVEVCDAMCLDVFIKNKWALHKTVEWAKSNNIYIKRAAFIIMKGLAKEDKEAKNFVFRVFLPILIHASEDERTLIQEAVTQALIEIGKRNLSLKKSVITSTKELAQKESLVAKQLAKVVIQYFQ